MNTWEYQDNHQYENSKYIYWKDKKLSKRSWL